MGRNRLWILILLMSGMQLLHAAGNPSAGKEQSETCAGCHGADGNSATPIFPKLAGQHASYLAKQLHDFKSQKRSSPTMTAISGMLNDSEIDDLSAFYTAQKVTVEKSVINKLGEDIYRTGNLSTGVAACSGCHGPQGEGNLPAVFPALNGQYAAYIEKTLRDFKTGVRANDNNSAMRSIATKLSDEEITAVADYISGLK
jgi:cytochrome c553